jgi:hypothetical protein
MPAPRDYSAVVFGTTGIGFARPAIDGYANVQVVHALDVPCEEPGCSGKVSGQPCSDSGSTVKGKRGAIAVLHPSRIQLALLMRDSGELQAEEIQPIAKCLACSTHGGQPIGCPKHRCEYAGCVRLKVPGTDHCEAHGGKARTKMTKEKIARLRALKDEGMRQTDVANELGVSISTCAKYWRTSDPA